MKTSSFSPTVNGISNCSIPLQEESSCRNNSDSSSNIPKKTKLAENSIDGNKSVDIHSTTPSSQVLKIDASTAIVHVLMY